ncbi:hypothetical protein BC828DRAFT_372340 [Blastocladiella britannica]|nr:hypothetical protein BC828DRAFT_372340 [Blastocladiella britannica]
MSAPNLQQMSETARKSARPPLASQHARQAPPAEKERYHTLGSSSDGNSSCSSQEDDDDCIIITTSSSSNGGRAGNGHGHSHGNKPAIAAPVHHPEPPLPSAPPVAPTRTASWDVNQRPAPIALAASAGARAGPVSAATQFYPPPFAPRPPPSRHHALQQQQQSQQQHQHQQRPYQQQALQQQQQQQQYRPPQREERATHEQVPPLPPAPPTLKRSRDHAPSVVAPRDERKISPAPLASRRPSLDLHDSDDLDVGYLPSVTAKRQRIRNSNGTRPVPVITSTEPPARSSPVAPSQRRPSARSLPSLTASSAATASSSASSTATAAAASSSTRKSMVPRIRVSTGPLRPSVQQQQQQVQQQQRPPQRPGLQRPPPPPQQQRSSSAPTLALPPSAITTPTPATPAPTSTTAMQLPPGVLGDRSSTPPAVTPAAGHDPLDQLVTIDAQVSATDMEIWTLEQRLKELVAERERLAQSRLLVHDQLRQTLAAASPVPQPLAPLAAAAAVMTPSVSAPRTVHNPMTLSLSAPPARSSPLVGSAAPMVPPIMALPVPLTASGSDRILPAPAHPAPAELALTQRHIYRDVAKAKKPRKVMFHLDAGSNLLAAANLDGGIRLFDIQEPYGCVSSIVLPKRAGHPDELRVRVDDMAFVNEEYMVVGHYFDRGPEGGYPLTLVHAPGTTRNRQLVEQIPVTAHTFGECDYEQVTAVARDVSNISSPYFATAGSKGFGQPGGKTWMTHLWQLLPSETPADTPRNSQLQEGVDYISWPLETAHTNYITSVAFQGADLFTVGFDGRASWMDLQAEQPKLAWSDLLVPRLKFNKVLVGPADENLVYFVLADGPLLLVADRRIMQARKGSLWDSSVAAFGYVASVQPKEKKPTLPLYLSCDVDPQTGQFLTMGEKDSGGLHMWDLRYVRQQYSASVITSAAANPVLPTQPRWTLGHTKRIESVAFSPHERLLATAGYDYRMGIFDWSCQTVSTLS